MHTFFYQMQNHPAILIALFILRVVQMLVQISQLPVQWKTELLQWKTLLMVGNGLFAQNHLRSRHGKLVGKGRGNLLVIVSTHIAHNTLEPLTS